MRPRIEKIHLDLAVNWKLSRNQTNFKENFIVHLDTEQGAFRSEIAPNVRYGETPASIEKQFNEWLLKFNGPQSFEELDQAGLFHSLRFGLESVYLSFMAKQAGKTIWAYLNLPAPKPVATSFSMPILPVSEIAAYLRPLGRFQSLKIKVDAESGLDMLNEIKKHTQVKLRVDGNEAWKDLDDFMRFQAGLKGMNIEFIEQPFPSTMAEEYRVFKKNSPYVLLGDESIEDVGNFSELSKQFHAVNIKLMKTGSLLKARDLILEAKHYGMHTMMGCMIETSIGISYGMLFSGMVDYVDLDGFLLIREEPFRLIEEKDGILNP